MSSLIVFIYENRIYFNIVGGKNAKRMCMDFIYEATSSTTLHGVNIL